MYFQASTQDTKRLFNQEMRRRKESIQQLIRLISMQQETGGNHVCPACTRKIGASLGFDVAAVNETISLLFERGYDRHVLSGQ